MKVKIELFGATRDFSDQNILKKILMETKILLELLILQLFHLKTIIS